MKVFSLKKKRRKRQKVPLEETLQIRRGKGGGVEYILVGTTLQNTDFSLALFRSRRHGPKQISRCREKGFGR